MKTFVAFVLTAVLFGGLVLLSAFMPEIFGVVLALGAFLIVWSVIRDALN